MTNLKFEIGKLYRTRDGQRAQIFMLDNGDGCMLGAIQCGDLWITKTWYADERDLWDLVSEWREPIKYSVELWGNEWKPDVDIEYTFSQHVTGIGRMWAKKKVEDCPIKYRITVEEIDDTAST